MKPNGLIYPLLLSIFTLSASTQAADPASDKQALERGRYLLITSGCNDCHTPGYIHRRETMADEAISALARGHGIITLRVDGNDVEAVHAVTAQAVAEIRATGQPQFLELVTYRLRGHFEPDDQGYVDQAELRHWQTRDPIHLLRAWLIDNGHVDAATLDALEQHCRARIADAE